MAARLLGDAKIGREVGRGQAQRLERLDVRAEHVLEGMRRVAFFDPLDVVDEHGRFLPLHVIPVAARTALDIKVLPDGTVTCSTTNRVQALRILAQHLDLIDPPEPVAPVQPQGPVTVNMTEIYLDGLSDAELAVLQRLFERKAAIDAQYGLGPATTPKQEPTS
jgi:hypothetical protein